MRSFDPLLFLVLRGAKLGGEAPQAGGILAAAEGRGTLHVAVDHINCRQVGERLHLQMSTQQVVPRVQRNCAARRGPTAAAILEGNVLTLEKQVEWVLTRREGAGAERAFAVALSVRIRIEGTAAVPCLSGVWSSRTIKSLMGSLVGDASSPRTSPLAPVPSRSIRGPGGDKDGPVRWPEP